MKFRRFILLSAIVLMSYPMMGKGVDQMDLSGNWLFKAVGIEPNGNLEGMVRLPGTLDENGKGIPNKDRQLTTHLGRQYTYTGKASYSREISIPKSWNRKSIYLHLERTKTAKVWIDGRYIGSCNHISTPQTYALGKLKPGKHKLTIIVDNSSGVPTQLYKSSHAYSEDTQTNWNGIIGQIFLSLSPQPYDKQVTSIKPCFKDFHADQHHFYANGHRIFLRGKNDACVWPLTAYCPMDVESWLWYFGTCQAYGINHVRFHSWCPPEAAFQAADSLGIYLQPELPFWGNFDEKDTTLIKFIHQEGINILQTYGHHPSFVMMALGNELWGSIPLMKQFTDDFRKIAPHILYTFGSNCFLGYEGIKNGMDYFTTCRIGGEQWGEYNTHTRGSFSYADVYDGGMLNHFHPNTQLTFDAACNDATIPIISHETGQFQSYPDYDEMEKYKGVLKPYNFQIFKNRLQAAGMLDQAKDFHRCSYNWTKLLYKADIEMDLRTNNMAGFQLLDLQDYPGQGTALVGLLDAFMEPKADKNIKSFWRQFCNDVVPLFVSDRLTFASTDTLALNFQIANYSGRSLEGQSLRWQLVLPSQDVPSETSLASGQLTIPVGEGLIMPREAGNPIPVSTVLSQLRKISRNTAWKLSLRVSVGENYANSYDIWVYDDVDIEPGDILITQTLSEDIKQKLKAGAKVLWMPDSAQMHGNTVGGLFQTDYWNYRMFKTICDNKKVASSPGTLGIMTNPEHPLFSGFPTDEHTNWQWFPIIKASNPVVLDRLPQTYHPVVQVIDNVERNHKLGLACEFKVGAGKLLLVMSNLNEAAKYPEGKAFYHSILSYMSSPQFNPNFDIDIKELTDALTHPVSDSEMQELHNISNY
ncbi:MAG: sugar-binding domain-containing protein [Prevotella sp.]|jgi:hypothetical protein